MCHDQINSSPADNAASAIVWTEDRIRALGAITDLPTAGRVFGLSRATSYELARTNQFPVPVIRVGARYRVPVAAILATLGLTATVGDLTATPQRSVDHRNEISSPDLAALQRRTDRGACDPRQRRRIDHQTLQLQRPRHRPAGGR